MRLTLIHPSIGRRARSGYIRTWQMEPLPPALIAGLTPSDVELRFYDDRMEQIPYDEPTDMVALSIETYTALRCYQIASEYRRRGVPVVMGGFHATLCPMEVADYAEAVVVGEAEKLWPKLIDDFRYGKLEKFYRSAQRPPLGRLRYNRDIFQNKRYLPLGLVEAGRGCKFKCDFCAIQQVFANTHGQRPVDDLVEELRTMVDRKLIFFVDDNFASDIPSAKEFLGALIPLRLRWVTQMSINAAHDDEFLELLERSGCKGVLIGFESLNPTTLRKMKKGFNTMRGGYDVALANLRRHRIRVYATFVFGYDEDTPETFRETIAFAKRQRFFITAFNHLTPFPATPLYDRLQREGRLLYERWWLDDAYRYNGIPFQPRGMSPDELRRQCVAARSEFYSVPSIVKRGFDPVNRSGGMMRSFFLINAMHRTEIAVRNHFPLGDETWHGPLLKAQ